MQGVDPRRAFVASKKDNSRILFACDYSQKEVRILAHMSGDKTLMSLFQGDKNVDIYKQMTSIIRNKPIISVTPEERAQLKQVTLAILYGMSPKQVAKKLDISDSAAVQIMKDFFGKFSGLKKVRGVRSILLLQPLHSCSKQMVSSGWTKQRSLQGKRNM
jgi:DNA polymerase-1